jgi:7-cyano-7-deazaguanine synthase
VSHTVVVLSGGLDSTAVMALYAARGHQLTAVTVDYGQRHRREVDAATAVARHYGAEHVVAALPGLGSLLSGSALTSPEVPLPLGHYAAPSMAATVVPNRNAILANVAAGVAVARRAKVVALGVHAGDHPVYPDCRPEFVTALNACVAAATAGMHTPLVEAPFQGWTKGEVVALAVRLGAPLDLTWSCYAGGDVHCGRCGTCTERREAFTDAGVPDPTTYA